MPITPAASGGLSTLTWAETLVMRLTLVYLFTFLFEGVLRFVLAKAHLASLLYLRDLLPVMAVLVLVSGWMTNRYQPSALLVTVALLAFHFFIGFFFLSGVFQQLFGLKMLMPMVLGMAVGTLGMISIQKTRTLTVWVILILVASLCVNYVIPFPWEGGDFESVFGVTTQSKSWTAGSVRRLAGVTRSSYDAATALLYCAVIAMATFRGVWVRVLLWLLCMVGIALTTSKAAEVALLALAAVMICSNGAKRLGWLRFSVIACAVLVVGAPLLSLLVDIRVRDFVGSWAWWLSSYADRMQNTWPQAISLLIDHGNVLIGRGIGGVGTAQQYGEGQLHTPADNIFVYWTLAAGMVSWLYAGAILRKLMVWDAAAIEQRALVFGFFVSMLTYGIAANNMEQPLSAFGLGYAVAFIFRQRQAAHPLRQHNVL